MLHNINITYATKNWLFFIQNLVFQFEDVVLDLFSDPVISECDVFSSWFNHLMFWQVYRRLVIDIDDRFFSEETELFDESL